MLNKSGETGHSCLVPDLKGKTLSFSLVSMMLAVVFSYMAFIIIVLYIIIYVIYIIILEVCFL